MIKQIFPSIQYFQTTNHNLKKWPKCLCFTVNFPCFTVSSVVQTAWWLSYELDDQKLQV